MMARIKIYIIIGLLASLSFLGLYIKILNQDLQRYQELERKEIKKQKITKKYVEKIKNSNVPHNDIEFERMLSKIFAD